MFNNGGLYNMSDFDGKRILVTGGTGFLGKAVVSKLKQLNPDKIITFSSNQYNLLEKNQIQELLYRSKPNIVIHLAAKCGGIEANRAKPAEFFYDNLMMGTQLLHECYKQNIEKTVLIGTICAYPKFATIPFKEEEIWNGYPEETNAPYGLAKKMLLVQSQAYRQQYGYNSIYLLPVNLYGPNDNFDLTTSHVIPALIRKCIHARENNLPYITAWGDGSPTREFLYVDDAAEGIILGALKYNKSEPVNLGSSYEISIKDLIETIAKLTEYKGEIIWDKAKPNGQPRRKLDTTKAEQELGFKSSTHFETGLAKTIEWYNERNYY